MTNALRTLRLELQAAETQLAAHPAAQRVTRLKNAIAVLSGPVASKPRRRMSAETREKLRQAGLKRWHGNKSPKAVKAAAKS
jgi:hypothetical protein